MRSWGDKDLHMSIKGRTTKYIIQAIMFRLLHAIVSGTVWQTPQSNDEGIVKKREKKTGLRSHSHVCVCVCLSARDTNVLIVKINPRRTLSRRRPTGRRKDTEVPLYSRHTGRNSDIYIFVKLHDVYRVHGGPFFVSLHDWLTDNFDELIVSQN